jgi:hypothetical protein
MKANVVERVFGSPRARPARNLFASRLKREATTDGGCAPYLEAVGIGCLITLVSGVLPLVMLLHR